MDALALLDERVQSYLTDMGLEPDTAEDGLYLFKYGSTVVMCSLFKAGDETLCRFVSVVLKEVEPTLELLHKILKLNTEVLFGSFLLFEDNTLCFTATLLGDHLDFEEFDITLRYVAEVSDDHDERLQVIAGGQRAQELLAVP